MKRYIFLIIICLFELILTKNNPIEFVIVTPSFNNERWCIKNIESVACQSYQHWHMIIINDCSTDQTGCLINEYVENRKLRDKITIINNTERKGALCNIYETIHTLSDHDVVVLLDGDDFLKHAQVLQYLARIYSDPTVWLTYGQYERYPSQEIGHCRAFPERVIKHRLFRSHTWLSSHVRTFYAWLFKQIKREDLLHEGTFMPVAWDLAIMFPMLEMASQGHIRFIADVLYVYNMDNPLNDHKQKPGLQQWLNQYLRKKARYEAL